MKNKNILLFSVTMLILLLGISMVSAADTNNSLPTSTQITKDTSAIQTTTIQNKVITSDNTKYIDTKKTNTTKTTKDTNIQKSSKTIKNTEIQDITKKSNVQTSTKTLKKDISNDVRNVTDYNSLKQTWTDLDTNGNSQTNYTINVKNGEYNFDECLSIQNKNLTYLTVIGENKEKTIFNGQNKTRLFFLNNTNLNITFKNITFKNTAWIGKSGGGATINSNSILNIECCEFNNNHNYNTSGGVLYVMGAKTTIKDSSFNNNSAKGSGGVIYYFSKGQVVVDHCNFTSNHASNGGVFARSGYPPMLNASYCNFINNSANSNSVLYTYWLYDTAPHYITNSLFINNTKQTIGISGNSNAIIVLDNNYFNGELTPSNVYNTVSCLTVNNNIGVVANHKSQGTVFTQADKKLTLNTIALGKYSDNKVTSIGCSGYSIPITTDASYINTTGMILSSSNDYTATIDLTKLPENFDDFSIYADGVKVATVTYKKTDIQLSPITAKTGSTIVINATFTENGKLLEKGKVAFKINGKTIGYDNVSFGKASLTYKLPDYAAKKYNITVVYGENNKYVSAKQNTTLTLQKLNTKTTFTTKTINDTLRINVKTIDEHNKTVNTGKIAVKLNGKTIGLYNNTDSVDYKIPQSWTNKNVTVLVIYGENSVYNTSRHQEKITIKQNNLKNKQSSMKKYDIIVNYYVSSTGSDSNNGTQESPFKTIAYAISKTTNDKIYNIYLTGTFKGVGNTNLTVPGDYKINFIGQNATIDGEANYTIKETLDTGEYYWGSSTIWYPYLNASGNWAMNITKGNGHITISNLTIQNCWSAGGSDISLYKTATIDNYGNLEVDNVNFIKNCAGVGAGIRNNANATVIVRNSMFDGNRKASSTGNYGAGLYNNGTATIINSTFQNNLARWGTVTSDKNLTIINSTIRDNIGYDGGSTYKTGSGITINTGSTNFYAIGSIGGISTVIDGCTFINNDQLDVSADMGNLNLTNNLFNRSTGVVVPSSSAGENLKVKYYISNNTFISPIGSSLYNSLSSTDNVTLALRLSGQYNYTITNNKVVDLRGTNSKAIELSANHAVIKNNTVDRKISIKGDYNTITDNNVTSTLDLYAVDLIAGSLGYNTVVNNYLVTGGFKGNAAVNYTQRTNIVENNTPETLSIEVDDTNFNNFFDSEGNLLPSFKNVEQVQIVGTLTNKNIKVNKEISIFQTNKKLTSYNITITTTENGRVDVNSLIIVNNNKKPVIILNSLNNKIEKTNLKTDNTYTITTTKTNNTIINNELVADILVGDESVDAPADNTITGNTPTYINYLLSNKTYDKYFDENGIIKNISTQKDIHFVVDGTIANKNFILNNNRTITITNYNNALLINSTITTLGTTNLNMSNIAIINKDKVAIELNTPANTINYNNITTNTNAVNIINSTKLEFNYNNIVVNSTNNVSAITIKDSNSTKNNIKYNNIETYGPATDVDWTTGRVGTTSIEILNTTGMYLMYNNITTTYNSINGKYDTIYSINMINPEISSTPNTLINNHIYTYGNSYAYGVNYINQTSYLSGGAITTEAKVQATGAQITTSKRYYRNEYNIYGVGAIDFISSSPVAYGVILSACDDFYVDHNDFILNGNKSVGISIYGTNNTILGNNNFQLSGNSTKAIEVIKSNEIIIKSNTITVFTNNPNYPIELLNTTKTEITKNTIITPTQYTVLVDKDSTLNSITDNILYAGETIADETVLTLNSNNRVRNNTPTSITNFYLNDNTYDKFFYANGTLRPEVPTGLTIQLTGSLTNKVLNITRPITIIADKTNYINTTIIISSDNVTIKGAEFTGENTKLIVNGNNNTVEIISFNVDNTQSRNLTPIIVNGQNNNIKITSTMGINSDTKLNSNITVITINGKNNTVDVDGISSYYMNNVIGILLNNAVYNNVNLGYMYASNSNVSENIVLRNSNYNNIYTRQSDCGNVEKYIPLTLDNSSYNNVSGGFSQQGNPINTTALIIKNNSNNNKINGLRISFRNGILDTPIIIENSHNNTIVNSQFTFENYEGYVIEIREGMGNLIEYNVLKSLTLDGDMAVIQENKNDTVNNIVQYNSATIGKEVKIDLTTPTTIPIDTPQITITANVTVINGTMWDSPYVPVEQGTLSIYINGVEYTYTMNGSIISMDYTLTGNENGQLFIEAVYKDQKRENRYTIVNKTITLTKYTPTIIVGTNTNNSTTILTAIILDNNKNIIYNGRVAFKINGKTVGHSEIKNGLALLVLDTRNYNVGNYTVTCVYGGNNHYTEATGESILTINSLNIKQVIIPVTTKTGSTITLTSYLTSDDKTLVTNGCVVFKLNGKTLKDEFGNILYGSVTNGMASITYSLPNTMAAKEYILTAVAAGHNYDRIETNTTFTVEKQNTQVILNPQHVKRSNKTQITAQIIDETGNFVTGTTKVAIKLNNKTIAHTTASNGILNTTLDLSIYKQSYFDLTIVAGENNLYNSSKSTNALIIE